VPQNNWLIRNSQIVTPLRTISDGFVKVENGRIAAIGQGEARAPNGFEVYNAEGRLLSPGLIDLHVHGGGGADTLDGTSEALHTIALANAHMGTTSILPTLISASERRMMEALGTIARTAEGPRKGAVILGAHLEGPFINAQKRGVHPAEYIQDPSVEIFHQFLKAAGKWLKILTLAPEMPQALEVVKGSIAAGVIPSAGHTAATYLQMMAGFDAGICYAAHAFNAMSGFESREPGAVGALLASPQIWTEVIADGLHVHPASVDIFLRAHGTERALLVTDAVRPTGTNMKAFKMGDIEAEVRNGGSFTKQGRLCGSILTMNVAVKNLTRWTKLPIQEILRMGTSNPARALGLEETKGSIGVGKDADLVVFDENFKPTLVLVEGNRAL